MLSRTSSAVAKVFRRVSTDAQEALEESRKLPPSFEAHVVVGIRESEAHFHDYEDMEGLDAAVEYHRDLQGERDEDDESVATFNRWDFTSFGFGGTKQRHNVVTSLQRAIENTYQAPICFLGGARMTYENKYDFVRYFEQVGDIEPNYLVYADGKPQTFRVSKWTEIDATKKAYRILRWNESYDPIGWVSFTGSINRRVLFKEEDVYKDGDLIPGFEFIRLSNVSEMDQCVYVAADNMALRIKYCEQQVVFCKPWSEEKSLSAAVSRASKKKREPRVFMYEFPYEWLSESSTDLSDEALVYLSHFVTDSEEIEVIDATPEEALQIWRDYFGRFIDDAFETEEAKELATFWLEKLKNLDQLEENLEMLYDISTSRCNGVREDVVYRAGGNKGIENTHMYASFTPVHYGFEGREYECEAKASDPVQMDLGFELEVEGFSKRGQAAVLNLQFQNFINPVVFEFVAFKFDVETTMRSLSTNKRDPKHGTSVSGQFWQEKVGYTGTYKGVWFAEFPDKMTENGQALCNLVNNQLFAEFIHGTARPFALKVSATPLRAGVPWNMEGKSLYLDSGELGPEGVASYTVDALACTKRPISGVAKRLSENQRAIMQHPSMRLEVCDEMDGVVQVTILCENGKRAYVHLDDWDLSKFDPKETPERNYERMIGVSKSGTKLERLVTKTPTPSVSEPVKQVDPPEKTKRTTIQTTSDVVLKNTKHVTFQTDGDAKGETEETLPLKQADPPEKTKRTTSQTTSDVALKSTKHVNSQTGGGAKGKTEETLPLAKEKRGGKARKTSDVSKAHASASDAGSLSKSESFTTQTKASEEFREYQEFKKFLALKNSTQFADMAEEDVKLESLETKTVKTFKFLSGKTWEELLTTSSIRGVAVVELESDFSDFIKGGATYKDFSNVHPEVVKLFKKAKKSGEYVALKHRKGSKRLAPQFSLPKQADKSVHTDLKSH